MFCSMWGSLFQEGNFGILVLFYVFYCSFKSSFQTCVIIAITISADLSIFHFIWNQFTKIFIEVFSFFNEPLTTFKTFFSPHCLSFLVQVAMVAIINISSPLSSTDSGVVGLLFKTSFNSSFDKFFTSSSVDWLGFRFRFPQQFWNVHHF